MDHSAGFRSVFQRQVDTYRSGDVAAYLEGYAPDATILVAGSQVNLDRMCAA
jgi:hypothetical protein